MDDQQGDTPRMYKCPVCGAKIGEFCTLVDKLQQYRAIASGHTISLGYSYHSKRVPNKLRI